MKILLIAPQPFYEKRGTPLAVALLAKALGELGHEIDLLTYHIGSDFPISNIRHIRSIKIPLVTSISKGLSFKKLLLDFFIFIKATKLVLKNRYDCIHGVEEGCFIGVVLKYATGIQLVYDMDSSIPEQLKDSSSHLWSSAYIVSLANKLESWAISNANLALVVCKALKDKVEIVCPTVPVEVLEDIPVSEKATNSTAEDVYRLRLEFQLLDKHCVVYTGTFEEYQGIHLLLESAEIILQLMPDLIFVLVGGSPSQVQTVSELCKQMQIFSHMRIIGRRPLEEMPAFMSLADILVSPRTLGSNTPMKIYSYMQSGRPIVATRLITHTQVLDDTVALLVSPDPASFADAIHVLLNDNEYAHRLSAAAYDLVDNHYTYAVFKSKLQRAYSRLDKC